MVEEQISARGIHDERVLAALRTVPRHAFLPEHLRQDAYLDTPLPIGSHQTISQPYIVALMTELLGLDGDERVLEVGTGSGYQAAVLSLLAREVFTIERRAELAARALQVLARLHCGNVEVVVGDGTCGLAAHAPYHGIIVTAAAPHVPQPLLDQLAPGGTLVLPVGEASSQVLEVWRRTPAGLEREEVAPVAFVPLIGEHGWSDDAWG
ncbi:MAG: protein-L-isoaspartate(D-aspartate) O-methyltransferase [Chloroflexi bacterium]|nr:protein-L-isoaspartate(D-aspartate) O-methyltransferase [Chloroflexota bacterium]